MLVVSPNNPTGSMLRADDRDWLVEIAREHDLALVSDEVFADYPISPRPDATSLAGEHRALTFTLGGLSKSVGLPQIKLAWIVVSGPDDARGPGHRSARRSLPIPICPCRRRSRPPPHGFSKADVPFAPRSRLAFAGISIGCDPRLWPQPSLTMFDARRRLVRRRARSRPQRPRRRSFSGCSTTPVCSFIPGYFFDFPEEAFLVLSLLPGPDVFDEAIRRIVADRPGSAGFVSAPRGRERSAVFVPEHDGAGASASFRTSCPFRDGCSAAASPS